MSPKYRLLYFDTQGKAEPIRFLLAYGNIQYEDVRYSHEDFKEKIKPTLTFGQVPILEVDGLQINQSNAIARYIARKLKITGKTEVETALADALVESLWDMASEYHRTTDAAVKDQLIPIFLSKVEGIVKKNGGYLVGSELTWADIVYASMADTIEKHFEGNLQEQYPHLYGMIEKVKSLPNIKKWIQERPVEKPKTT